MQLEERRPPDSRRPCPECGPGRKEARNRKREVLGVWEKPDGREQVFCNRCGFKGIRGAMNARAKTGPVKAPRDKSKIARFLWSISVEASGTPVERYITIGRGIGVTIPGIIRYLPQNGRYPHAMITAFGQHPLRDGISAVHLTRLSDDGLRRFDKRMLGPIAGTPLALAPIGADKTLFVVEGIEDALSIKQAFACGVWAAGSATHLKGLATAIAGLDCEPVIVADSDKAGIDGATRLFRALSGLGVHAQLKVLPDG